MAKRHLSGRQKRRIQDQQQTRLDRSSAGDAHTTGRLADSELGPEQPGRVVVSHGRVLLVEADDGTRHRCHARQNLGHAVCGDRVAWQPSQQGNGVVSALAERRNALSRPGARGAMRAIAANLDRVVVVIASAPPFAEAMIDRYLVAAELAAIPAALLLNKVDLLDAVAADAVAARLAGYVEIGYPLYRASTHVAHGLNELTAALADGTSVLVGQSGVGKSSLINALVPGREIEVGDLSRSGAHGTHTTTSSTLYHLPGGGALIDSPGVWEFGPPVTEPGAVEHGFREFGPYLGRCHYANCRHLVEPDCALQAAVASGDVSARRLASYRALYEAVRDGVS